VRPACPSVNPAIIGIGKKTRYVILDTIPAASEKPTSNFSLFWCGVTANLALDHSSNIEKVAEYGSGICILSKNSAYGTNMYKKPAIIPASLE
tara:strand:- start:4718 stop:4996 length:279 start_codon:yes stop_codon:yes gene_type:complete